MLISIITVNYNNVDGLKKTFNNLKNQSYQDFELVVIDGGSNDGSIDLIKTNDSISYWVSEKDNGVYHAMNKGIKKATGEYVIFMNSGDIFYDDHVMSDFIADLNEGHDLVYGNALYYNDTGYLRKEIAPKILTFAFFRDTGINHQSAFIKRKLFYDSFFYNEAYKISADWDFFIRNVCLNDISYKHKDRFVCRCDHSGITAAPENYQIYIGERQETLKRYFKPFNESFYDKTIQKVSHKRLGQFIFLKNYKIAWKLVRALINICLFFIPKKKFHDFMNT